VKPSFDYTYDDSFMRLAALSRRSAELIIDLLRSAVPITNVADFGCALGTWLSAWRDAGVTDVIGIDGGYVSLDKLQIPRECFRQFDLGSTIQLGRRFDLVESLEVAEHLPEHAAGSLVASLVSHSDLVLFSAAPPGQGGENHLNEQPYEYWRKKFQEFDYKMLDWLRPQIRNAAQIQYWYRYNLFLFVARERMRTLPSDLQRSEIKSGQGVQDVSPWPFRLRKQIVRRMPGRLQNGLSRAMTRFRAT